MLSFTISPGAGLEKNVISDGVLKINMENKERFSVTTGEVGGIVTKIRQEVRRVMMMDDDNVHSFAVKGTFKPKECMMHYG